MRMRVIVVAFGAGVGLTGAVWVAPASAQSPFDGPLAAPDAPALPAPKARARTKPKASRHAAARPVAVPDAAARPVPTNADAPPPSPGAPADPVSLGMKWNGSNDTAAQTRYQNGPENAFGSGAEVGMKLHF